MAIEVIVATEDHVKYAVSICTMIEEAAKKRGTGIAKRDPEYVKSKMMEGKAIIALDKEENSEKVVGFCYIETWSHNKYVANSGLIVDENYRQHGLAKQIKYKAFELSRSKYPDAKLFGLTTSLPVMKINTELGYRPATFAELTDDDSFWKGCQSCVNYDILTRTNRKMCLCTGMIMDPNEKKKNDDNNTEKK